MARLQKESGARMSFRLQETRELEERIIKDESRMDEVNDTLMERDLLAHSKETDDLIQEWHNLNARVEQSKNRLAQLKSPLGLDEEDKQRLPKAWKPDERNNIKY